MDDGRIIECGAHAELMGLNGLYARMYSAQADLYHQNNHLPQCLS
jgi:ABC-type multidrug transport system fused ATPase/permease subunit